MTKQRAGMCFIILFCFTLLFGCGKEVSKIEEKKNETTANLLMKNYTIAISQFSDSAALDLCREGFLEELASEGIVEDKNLTLVYQNAGAEKERAKLIADTFATTEQDLIFSMGSTSSSLVLEKVRNKKVPILFAAVTDPVASELVDTDGIQRDEITGISTPEDLKQQLEIIHRVFPKVRKIGVIYTKTEVNSVATIERLHELTPFYHIRIIAIPVESVHEVASVTDDLLSKADCILNIQDNMVTSQLPVVLKKSLDKNIPVVGSDQSQAEAGCILSVGHDYQLVGRKAGKMAIQILKGTRFASEISIKEDKSMQICLNQNVADQMEIDIPDSVKDELTEIYGIKE